MSKEQEYPSYNINVGVATEISSLIEIKTYKYHPYGLEGFRKDLIEHIDEWQSKGLSWQGHDNLTHAWRTPWDIHIRYEKLMSPIVATVLGIVKNHSPDSQWFLKDSWISEYTQNSAANKHNHGEDTLGWSFCYYVKVPDSGPGFTLCDDVDGSMSQLNVAEGDLLIFRHPLKHQVFPALERRIIISGNILTNDFVPISAYNKYYNENFQNEDAILSAIHSKVNLDDWSQLVIEQKLGIKLTEGY
jgi:hypothetical protein